jgi:large subunit ribosomal protein L17
MNHRKTGRKLSRTKKLRTALLKSLLGSFVMNDKMKTTEAKAKEIRPLVEKLITAARKKSDQTVELKRFLASRLPAKAVAKAVVLATKKYQSRPGGYTRISKISPRKSDGAKMAIIEWV